MRPENTRTRDAQADAPAHRGRRWHVVLLAADMHIDDRLAVVALDGDDAETAHVVEVFRSVFTPWREGARRLSAILWIG